jgi:hypothetical protein
VFAADFDPRRPPTAAWRSPAELDGKQSAVQKKARETKAAVTAMRDTYLGDRPRARIPSPDRHRTHAVAVEH